MQTAAKTNLILIDSPSDAEFTNSPSAMGDSKSYLRLVFPELVRNYGSRQEIQLLADELIRLAEHAYSLREMTKVQDAGLILANLPKRSVRHVGRFYQALFLKRTGKKDAARILLESVAETAPLNYRARAIQTLGTICHEQGHLSEALHLYVEAARIAFNRNTPSLLANLMAQLQVCFIKSDIGDHQGALTQLKGLLPLVLQATKESPVYFYVYHNALAVEFSERTLIGEAQRACEIALDSPFAHAYPEWSATRDEIAAKCKSASRSVVAIQRAPQAEPTQQPRLELATTPRVIHGCSTYLSDFVQRAFFHFPATAITVLIAVSILLRMLGCTGPRSPPRF